jgi:hypothetical protein
MEPTSLPCATGHTEVRKLEETITGGFSTYIYIYHFPMNKEF